MAHSLTQSEVEALLAGLDTGIAQATRPETTSDPHQSQYPWAVHISQIGEEFCSHLTLDLERILRGRCEIRLAEFQSTTCGEVLSQLDARCFAVIESRQAGSHSLLAMDAGAVFPMIDGLLGGGPSPFEAAIPRRSLTELELKLMTRCISCVAASLERAWSRFHPVEFLAAHIEGRIPAAQLIAPRERVVALRIETAIGGTAGQIALVLPERLVVKLLQGEGRSPDASSMNQKPDVTSGSDVRVRLTSLSIEPEALALLSIGDVLPLNGDADLHEAAVFVNGKPAFTGEPGLNSGRKAVRIGKPVVAEQAIHLPDGNDAMRTAE